MISNPKIDLKTGALENQISVGMEIKPALKRYFVIPVDRKISCYFQCGNGTYLPFSATIQLADHPNCPCRAPVTVGPVKRCDCPLFRSASPVTPQSGCPRTMSRGTSGEATSYRFQRLRLSTVDSSISWETAFRSFPREVTFAIRVRRLPYEDRPAGCSAR